MIRWGIIGCGYIAGHMAKTIHNCKGAALAAAASRDIQRAKVFAEEHQIPKYYDSYEALANDADIDAVYVATINPTHFDAVKTCLLAGKAVLCEKPLAMNAGQAEELFNLAHEKKRLLMEAMWTRYLPAWREIKTITDFGIIGEIKEYTTDFSKSIPFDSQNRILNKEKGGGALLDLGIYCIHSAFSLFGPDYRSFTATGRKMRTGVDSYAAITLDYPNGVTALLTCASDMTGPKSARIHGAKGWIEIPRFSRADEFTIHLDNAPPETHCFPYEDGFTFELEEFQKLLCSGKKESETVPPKDTIAAHIIIESAMKTICGGAADK